MGLDLLLSLIATLCLRGTIEVMGHLHIEAWLVLAHSRGAGGGII